MQREEGEVFWSVSCCFQQFHSILLLSMYWLMQEILRGSVYQKPWLKPQPFSPSGRIDHLLESLKMLSPYCHWKFCSCNREGECRLDFAVTIPLYTYGTLLREKQCLSSSTLQFVHVKPFPGEGEWKQAVVQKSESLFAFFCSIKLRLKCCCAAKNVTNYELLVILEARTSGSFQVPTLELQCDFEQGIAAGILNSSHWNEEYVGSLFCASLSGWSLLVW